MSTCKGPKKFSNFAQKLAYVGRVLIKLWYSSIENHIRPRSFKILAMAVGPTFFEKKKKKKKRNLKKHHKIKKKINSKYFHLKLSLSDQWNPHTAL